jgi:hypothetical protein
MADDLNKSSSSIKHGKLKARIRISTWALIVIFGCSSYKSYDTFEFERVNKYGQREKITCIAPKLSAEELQTAFGLSVNIPAALALGAPVPGTVGVDTTFSSKKAAKRLFELTPEQTSAELLKFEMCKAYGLGIISAKEYKNWLMHESEIINDYEDVMEEVADLADEQRQCLVVGDIDWMSRSNLEKGLIEVLHSNYAEGGYFQIDDEFHFISISHYLDTPEIAKNNALKRLYAEYTKAIINKAAIFASRDIRNFFVYNQSINFNDFAHALLFHNTDFDNVNYERHLPKNILEKLLPSYINRICQADPSLDQVDFTIRVEDDMEIPERSRSNNLQVNSGCYNTWPDDPSNSAIKYRAGLYYKSSKKDLDNLSDLLAQLYLEIAKANNIAERFNGTNMRIEQVERAINNLRVGKGVEVSVIDLADSELKVEVESRGCLWQPENSSNDQYKVKAVCSGLFQSYWILRHYFQKLEDNCEFKKIRFRVDYGDDKSGNLNLGKPHLGLWLGTFSIYSEEDLSQRVAREIQDEFSVSRKKIFNFKELVHELWIYPVGERRRESNEISRGDRLPLLENHILRSAIEKSITALQVDINKAVLKCMGN